MNSSNTSTITNISTISPSLAGGYIRQWENFLVVLVEPYGGVLLGNVPVHVEDVVIRGLKLG